MRANRESATMIMRMAFATGILWLMCAAPATAQQCGIYLSPTEYVDSNNASLTIATQATCQHPTAWAEAHVSLPSGRYAAASNSGASYAEAYATIPINGEVGQGQFSGYSETSSQCWENSDSEDFFSDSFTLDDLTPIVTGINPSQWAAGQTTNVTFTGQYFGTNQPTLNFSPSSGISYSLVSYNDAQIVANITVDTGTPSESVSVTVTNNGYGGFEFQSNGTSSPDSSPANANILSVQVPTFSVAYSAYIPVDHVMSASTCSYSGAGNLLVPYMYLGDANRGTYRTTESIQMTPDPQQSTGFFRNTGQTRNYGAYSPANGSALSASDEDGVGGDCYLWNASATADPSGFTHDESYPYAHQGQVHYSGSATNPLEPPAPINWDMRTVIDTTNANSPTAYVNYNHTCYPAHQVKVNGVIVYLYTPPSNSSAQLFNCLFLQDDKIIGQQASPTTVPTH